MELQERLVIGKKYEYDPSVKNYTDTFTQEELFILPQMMNRHGLITGATGTGKTTTIRTMTENLSKMGVPVFLCDIKGDMAGLCETCPVSFWDIYQEKGMPLRTTISEMGPVLLAKILGLNDIQTDVLKVLFKMADDENLLLIDTKDLKAMLNYAAENAKDFSLEYGNMSKQSLSAIIRAVVALESDGADLFFGEEALNIFDWVGTSGGYGKVQILDGQKLSMNANLYGTFMMWLIAELYEMLPEIGDLKKPKMVFFFDEAHLLFNGASKTLLDKIEQLVKLIRSKGVGIYFISQNPQDIPDGVLAQLGNKIQHNLNAYTPAEQKKVKAASQSYRVRDDFNTYEAMMTLGIGQVLISVLDENGVPTFVDKGKIDLPQTSLQTIDDNRRNSEIQNDDNYLKYSHYHDEFSAYEFLTRKAVEDAEALEQAKLEAQQAKEQAKLEAQQAKEQAKLEAQQQREQARLEAQQAKELAKLEAQKKKEQEKKNSVAKRAAESTAKTAAGTVGRELGNALGSSVGGKFGKRLGGNVGASLGRGILSTLFKL